MRFPSSRFTLQARGKKGVILENDGELVLPPVIQPIAVVGDPISLSGDRDGKTSAYAFLQSNRVGAGGAATADTILFESGLWHYEANVYAYFTGATNLNENMSVGFIDPGGNEQILFSAFLIAGMAVNARIERWINLQAEANAAAQGFILRNKIGATVAGDTARLIHSYNLHRVL